MYQPQYISALLLSFLTSFSTSNAWVFSTTNVDLSSPPPIDSGDTVINSIPQPDYTTGIAWPCYHVPVPDNVVRTPFPIRGGRFSWTLTNNTVGSLWNYQYLADTYFGDFSLGNGSYSTPSNSNGGNSGYGWVENYEFDDFSTGPYCSDPVDVVEVVSQAFGKYEEVEYLTARDIVGMNATVGVRIVLFGPNPLVTDTILDDENIEEMYQCGYITFTEEDLSNDPNAGYCNGGGALPTGSGASPSTLLTSILPSATGQPWATPPPSPLPTSGESGAATVSTSHEHTVAIGTGVGVSMGASLLILIIAFILLRRRRARKHTGTIGADVIVTRQQGIELTQGRRDEKIMAKGKVVESSASSTHSEPLPPYTGKYEA
ncbi:hypothetical protein N431DRAFT_560703 [Stipitochalara longipes BDJ]|nr:hypothetical protein N431DRAFT_560703 [Stipitochalara longipes BDJ]